VLKLDEIASLHLQVNTLQTLNEKQEKTLALATQEVQELK
jgi:hypothetical protein